MKRKDENVLMTLKTSRKLYTPFYFLVVLLGVFLIFLNGSGVEITSSMKWVFGIFAFLVINITETHRMDSTYYVTKDGISIRYGILNKKVINLEYYAISHVDVQQNFWQRLLGFGDVKAKVFSEESKETLKNINKPLRVAKIIEKAMKGEKDGKSG